MWIVNCQGFASVVVASEESKRLSPDAPSDVFAVRFRVREHAYNFLAALRSIAKPHRSEYLGRVVESAGSDYRFRILVSPSLWSRYLANASLDVDYDNFKEHFAHNCDARLDVLRFLRDVWQAGYELQEQLTPRRSILKPVAPVRSVRKKKG